MGISNELARRFAKSTVDKSKDTSGKTVTGTAVQYNGSMYVQIDGSDQLTPIISSTVGMKDGDRVTVLIKDHTTTVTGNTSSPSVNQDDIDNSHQEIVDQITEVEILVAEKASIKDLEAESARIDDLVADNVTIKDTLTASKAEIDQLKAKDVEITGNLTAQNAEIENLKATKLDVDIADIKYATVEKLEATDANIHNLQADYGEFKQLSTDKFAANEAEIKRLDAEKASIKDLDTKYANIDFANIGKAAIENLFSKSGMIGDLVVGEGTITGTLVGVTIKGDLIEGGTVKADKLVVQGEDGLYYKLNVSAEKVSAQQTEYNSLNGSIITAKSITAEKVNVHDLVAFGATIGGFHITDSAIYSGVKESINNTTRGTYMDDDGQFAIGDGSNYLKFFKDSDGKYKLDISAASIKFGASGETVENVVQDMVVKTETEYYISTSPTSLTGGSWSTASPTWSAGKYIWTRTKSTKKSGKVEYSNAACTTGAPGKDGVGTPGAPGSDGKTSYFHVKYSAVANPTTSDQMTETPSEYIGTYVDFTEADSTDPKKYTWAKFKGTDGSNGTPGKNGIDGKTSYLHIAYANSADGSSGFSVSDSAGKLYIGQYTDFTEADSTDPKKYSWTKIKGEQGSQGIQGKPGADGKTYYTWLKYADTPTSGMSDSPDGKKYMGLAYNKTSSTESTNYADYTWSLIKGTDGVAGKPGADGKSLYTWVKYADNASGAGMSDSPDGKKYIGLAYNKTTATESTSATDYSWSLIKGADGAAGVGVKSSAVTYQASSSGTTIPTSSWVTTIPTVSAGQYLWTKTVIAYTDGKSTTSYSVARMGQNGSNGAPGADGKPGTDGIGIKSTAITYQAGASQTSAPTGTWSTSVPKLSATMPYLWTKTIITYTDGKTSTSYSVGSTLDGVEVGGRNYIRASTLPDKTLNGVTVETDGPDVHVHGTNTGTVAYEIGSFIIQSNLVEPGETWTLSTTVPMPSGVYLGTNTRNASGVEIGAIYLKGDGSKTSLTGKIPANSNGYFRGFIGIDPKAKVIDVTFRIKLERGNKATDWTPAPEDVQQGINHAQTDADNANNKIDQIAPDVEFAKSQIEILNKSISSLVVDQNGGSLMTQTSDGWQFNIGAIQSSLNGAIGDIQDVQGDISGVKDLADKTSQLASDVAKKTAYINMTQDESGQPVMELGQQNGEFKLRITNTSMDFMQGSQRIAYLSNRQLYIQSSVVTDEMKIGAGAGFIWKKRANGNMGLRYVTS